MKTCVTLSWLAYLVMCMGCSSSHEMPSLAESRLASLSGVKYAIKPFLDLNAPKYKEKYPDAARYVEAALETALVNAGQTVVAEGSEDAFITGSVRAFYRGTWGGVYTTVGFDAKAVGSRTGEVLWKGSHSKTTRFWYKYDPTVYVNEVAKEFVEEIFVER